jgi:hypothetical protein
MSLVHSVRLTSPSLSLGFESLGWTTYSNRKDREADQYRAVAPMPVGIGAGSEQLRRVMTPSNGAMTEA